MGIEGPSIRTSSQQSKRNSNVRKNRKENDDYDCVTVRGLSLSLKYHTFSGVRGLLSVIYPSNFKNRKKTDFKRDIGKYMVFGKLTAKPTTELAIITHPLGILLTFSCICP